MSFKSIFADIWKFVQHTFSWLAKDADKVAIAITQDLNLAINSGLIDMLVSALAPVTGQLPAEVLATLKPLIPKILALELSLQGLPDNATPEQIGAFAEEVLQAFQKASTFKQTKIYTTLAAEIYNVIQEHLKIDGKLTFADVVDIIEKAYQGWVLAKAQNPDTSSMDALQSQLRVSTKLPVGQSVNQI